MTKLDYESIDRCRVCETKELESHLNLGDQALTGMFPRAETPEVPSGPLEIVLCPECGLVQLAHRYDPSQLYGPHYGYRSGLNGSMVKHLGDKVHALEAQAKLQAGDWVLDIGSNDGTTLGSYTTPGLERVGIDPTASHFRQYYAPGIHVVPDFYAADKFLSTPGAKPARLVTSLAMFYDLESPVGFAREVKAALAPDGLWHFEQSYLPTMLRNNSFDTICHEHVSYYSFGSIEWILERAGMKVVDVSFNDVNGGSFAITATHRDSSIETNEAVIEWIRAMEASQGMSTGKPLVEFAERTVSYTAILMDLLERLRSAGKKVVGYGASTKGNVLLQYAGITQDHVCAIGEINPEKFGCVTPGTQIPIVSDADARAMEPDYFLVLPWHFRADILRREQAFLEAGGRFIFPLPAPEIV